MAERKEQGAPGTRTQLCMGTGVVWCLGNSSVTEDDRTHFIVRLFQTEPSHPLSQQNPMWGRSARMSPGTPSPSRCLFSLREPCSHPVARRPA